MTAHRLWLRRRFRRTIRLLREPDTRGVALRDAVMFAEGYLAPRLRGTAAACRGWLARG